MKNYIQLFSQNNWFYRLYLAGFFIILLLPLLNWPIYFSPPNWAKTIVFQFVFSIILFAFLLQLLWQKDFDVFSKIKRVNKENLAFWFLLLLFLVQLLTTIISLDFNYSFFGTPYRGGGFVSYGFYILFAVITFLAVKDTDWKKLWLFAVVIGVLVSIIAIISRLGLFSKFLQARIDNVSSTIGGPNTLGLYMLVLVFPALIFAILERGKLKRGFYLLSAILFVFIIVLTISQGAYLGLAVGIMYFLILYPVKTLPDYIKKKAFYLKVAFVALMILAVVIVLIIKSTPDVSVNKNYLFRHLTTWQIDNSRLSAWQVAIKAFLDRPILGYGPENFSIGFDRHYDPSLPLLAMAEGAPASWWDKAHNFALNLLVETGIIGFLAFSLLFGLIFWRLHKLAHGKPKEDEGQNYEHINPIVAHGMQTALVAYFANLMFNFENFSSYIIVFLIVGYSLHLTIKKPPKPDQKQFPSPIRLFLFKYRKLITGVLFIILVCFLWFVVLKPFQVNAKINTAKFLADKKMCRESLFLLDKELEKSSITDGYLRQKYIEIIKVCLTYFPENGIEYANRATKALKQNVKIMPYYVRNWLLLSSFNNLFVAAETDPLKKEGLILQGKEYLEKAVELSPKRQEVLVEQINTYLLAQDYEAVKQSSEECMQKDPTYNACYWYLGVSQIFLSGNNKELLEEGKKNMEKAHSMGYAEISNFSLIQLVYLYIHQDDYQQLEWVYEKLTQFNPYNPRYFGGLAMVYKRNGKNEESKEAIKRILVIQSDVESIERGWVESQDTITSLLETIFGLKYNNPNYHKALYELQFEIGNLIEARKEARLYYGFYIQKPEVKNNPTLLNQAKKQLSDMLAKSSS